MKKALLILMTVIFTSAVAEAAVVLDFDALYTVASSGSTDQVTQFDLNGPKPWLYAKLPSSPFSLFPSASSDWFLDSEVTKKFSVTSGQFGTASDFWFSPSDTVWDNNKALGDWHVNSNFYWVSILWAENGGIGVGQLDSSGSGIANFNVSSGPTVTPEPISLALFGLGSGALGLARLRRRNK